jgi:hypothetical protein
LKTLGKKVIDVLQNVTKRRKPKKAFGSIKDTLAKSARTIVPQR